MKAIVKYTFILIAIAIGLIFMNRYARGDVTISSLPDTTDYDDSTYVLSGNLSSATNGILVNNDGVTINLGTDTLEFGTGDGNNNYGIQLFLSDNVTITGGGSSGGLILHDGSGSDNYGVDIRKVHDVYLESLNVTVGGHDGQCIYTADHSDYNYHFEINGGTYTNACSSYTRRDYYDGCAINLERTDFYDDGNWGFKIHNVQVYSHGQGIFCYGENDGELGLFYVYDNNIEIDALNSYYAFDDGSLGHSEANPYAISVSYAAPGTKIYNNTITSGTDHKGGRGILIEYAAGNSDSLVEIYNNDVDIHEGSNWESNGSETTPPYYGLVQGLRMRWECSYCSVYSNIFKCSGDTSSATDSYDEMIVPLRIQSDYEEGHSVCNNNTFVNNVFWAYTEDPPPAQPMAGVFEQIEIFFLTS